VIVDTEGNKKVMLTLAVLAFFVSITKGDDLLALDLLPITDFGECTPTLFDSLWHILEISERIGEERGHELVDKAVMARTGKRLDDWIRDNYIRTVNSKDLGLCNENLLEFRSMLIFLSELEDYARRNSDKRHCEASINLIVYRDSCSIACDEGETAVCNKGILPPSVSCYCE
jgi:hypothetical protein